MKSLRARLLLGVLAGIAVVLGVSAVAVHRIRRAQLRTEFDDSLARGAEAIRNVVLRSVRRPDAPELTAEEIRTIPTDRLRADAEFQVWFEGMRRPRRRPRRGGPRRPPVPEPISLVVRSAGLGGRDLPRLSGLPADPEVVATELGEGVAARALGITWTAGPRPPPEGPALTLTVVVAAPTDEIERGLAGLAALLAATTAAAMGLAVAIAWFAVGHGLRPLRRIAGRLATLDETRLGERLPEAGVPKELAPVVEQLNGLMRRLDAAFERERGLTADVAHELRTPLAGIRSTVEVALAHPRDGAEYREALVETLAIATSLQSVVERLLTLARLESGQTAAEVAPVPLRRAIDASWARVGDEAAVRGVTLAVDGSAEGDVEADPALLEIVLSNALGNAATYARAGSAVSVERANGTLTIANPTDEPPADPESMFDRFRRGDAARSAPGLRCGVGLTLVRRAMEAMGGTATASVDDGRFSLELGFRAGPDASRATAEA